jgi:predicted DNA-binding protein YlxM (UPF0122 family)
MNPKKDSVLDTTPEHPDLQRMLRENYPLLIWVDRRLRFSFDPNKKHRWPEGYFISYLTICLNKILYTWDPEKSKLGYYLDYYARLNVMKDFLKYESESWHLAYKCKKLSPEKFYATKTCQFYEGDLVKNESEPWFPGLLALFSDQDSLWDSLVSNLNDRQRRIIESRFKHKDSLVEIATREQVSKQRVSQLIRKAQEKVRINVLKKPELRNYLQGIFSLEAPISEEARKRKLRFRRVS